MQRTLLALSLALCVCAAGAQPPLQKISNDRGGLPDLADAFDELGSAVAVIGDVDGDGHADLAVGGERGNFVQILFLRGDASVRTYQRIATHQGGLAGTVDGYFGSAVAPLGDLDGDGVVDLAVGERLHGNNQGAVWILFLNTDGTVKAQQRIAEGEGGFAGTLSQNDRLGSALALLGDLDGDGVVDLAAGAEGEDSFRGSVYVLFLRADGTVKAQQRIGQGLGGFTGTLAPQDTFGCSVAATSDLSGDGIPDLAVGAIFDQLGGSSPRGAAYLLALDVDGTVKSHVKLVPPTAATWAQYGSSVAFPGDLDGDGLPDVVVGAEAEGPTRGAVYVHFLAPFGSANAVLATRTIGAQSGGFTGPLGAGDSFGASLAHVGDLDGDGLPELAVGATGDDDGGLDLGAVWRLDLTALGTVAGEAKIGSGPAGIPNTLELRDRFGTAIARVGDLDGDGVEDLVVGAADDDQAAAQAGAVWVLLLDAAGTVKSHAKITQGSGGFAGPLEAYDHFGSSVAALGDVDGDGHVDLAVGAPDDDQAGSGAGAVWILFLDGTGAVQRQQKIAAGLGGFASSIGRERLGAAVAGLGDLDGNGVPELAIGGPPNLATEPGSVWIAFLDVAGTVLRQVRISSGTGGFRGQLDGGDLFGTALCSLSDFDGNGVADLAVGAPGDDDGASAAGAVWILLMKSTGEVESAHKISAAAGNFVGVLPATERFGDALAATWLDGDGVVDLLVGQPTADGAASRDGVVWKLFLDASGTVRSHERIAALTPALPFALGNAANFGAALAPLGDLDGDGHEDWAAGVPGDDDGGYDHGALYLFHGDGSAPLWGYDPYGCQAPAASSLVALGGVPASGQTFALGVDNPLGTQRPGSMAALLLATAPDPAFPCGAPFPGLGMAGGGAPGEVLVSFVPPNPGVLALGTPWSGAAPVAVSLTLPAAPGLGGVVLYVQGVMLDIAPGTVLPIALASGLAVTIDG